MATTFQLAEAERRIERLIETLEWFSSRFHTNSEVAKQWAGSCSMSTAEWQDWEVRAGAAIESAKS